ncbi:MAG TPA: hypothetical protein VIT92_05405 [Burkholderiaceae bacterium]
MGATFRLLLLSLLMAVLPLRAIASVALHAHLPHAAAMATAQAETPPCHGEQSAKAQSQHDDCANCGDCCVAASALASSLSWRLPQDRAYTPAQWRAPALPAPVPDGLDRPPRVRAA